MIKVLVCGGRNYDDFLTLDETLENLDIHQGIELIIQGGAKGADKLAQDWAYMCNKPCLRVPAEWSKHGKKAGILRNIKMLQYGPNLVVAFPGGRGTAHMTKIAKEAGIDILYG